MKHYLYLFILASVLPIHLSKAQVTIGSGINPHVGALLDLKENDNQQGANSTKGMLLPRVQLTSRTNLYPMFNENDTEYIGAKKQKQDEIHVGLLVFHVEKASTKQENGDKIESGLYVWDGKRWAIIGQAQEAVDDTPKSDGRGMVIGKSGTKYKTRIFGSAGEWMVENLRETEYDKGVERPQIVKEKINQDNSYGEANYYYPNHDKKLFQKNPEYGLLYSLVAATNGQVTDRPEYEETSGRVQGLCPTGWVVPSRLDWRNLRAELEKNPELYSTNKNGVQIGYTTKSPTKVEASRYNVLGASSSDGFSALLVGTIRSAQTHDYGWGTSFWSSSVINDYNAYYRELQSQYNYAYPDNHSGSPTFMFSIRCMKKTYKEKN